MHFLHSKSCLNLASLLPAPQSRRVKHGISARLAIEGIVFGSLCPRPAMASEFDNPLDSPSVTGKRGLAGGAIPPPRMDRTLFQGLGCLGFSLP